MIKGNKLRVPISDVYLVVYGRISSAEPAVAIDAEPGLPFSRVSLEKNRVRLPSSRRLAAQRGVKATVPFQCDSERVYQLSPAETGTRSALHNAVDRYDEFEKDMERALQLSLETTGTSSASNSGAIHCSESASLPVQREINDTPQGVFKNDADILPVESKGVYALQDVKRVEESQAHSIASSSDNAAPRSEYRTSVSAQTETIISSQPNIGNGKVPSPSQRPIESAIFRNTSNFPESDKAEGNQSKYNVVGSNFAFGKGKPERSFTLADGNEDDEQEERAVGSNISTSVNAAIRSEIESSFTVEAETVTSSQPTLGNPKVLCLPVRRIKERGSAFIESVTSEGNCSFPEGNKKRETKVATVFLLLILLLEEENPREA